MPIEPDEIIDSHMHAPVLGDTAEWLKYGRVLPAYRQTLTFKLLLKYLSLEDGPLTDERVHQAMLGVLDTQDVGKVVCLAVDPVYDRGGAPHPEASNVWVLDDYVLRLQNETNNKVLFGASVHPFAPDFQTRVDGAVSNGAVLLKWIPSAQQFSLGDPKVGDAMEILASAKGGKPLPLLLHSGPEYAIPTTQTKTWTYDFISWNFLDRVRNIFGTWYTPDIAGTDRNLRRALDAGAIIIFAHCGLPYYSSGFLGNLVEHSDFDRVREWLQANAGAPYPGRCYADASALCTPMRKRFFPDVANLPADYIFMGSDFPTPTFELFEDVEDIEEDFKELMKGDLKRLLTPAGNLLDGNLHQLQKAFPGHQMFTNFARMLTGA